MSDVESREFWYNGKTFALLDKKRNLYSYAEAAATIDGTLSEIMDKYGYTPALSDFLYSDPYKTLMRNVLAGFYVGLGDVNGTRIGSSFCFIDEPRVGDEGLFFWAGFRLN